jgi:hypothetical protein
VEQRTPPITIRLGKHSRRDVKKLDRREGKAFEEVQAALDQVRASLGEEASTKELVPVVVVYKKKQKKGRSWLV